MDARCPLCPDILRRLHWSKHLRMPLTDPPCTCCHDKLRLRRSTSCAAYLPIPSEEGSSCLRSHGKGKTGPGPVKYGKRGVDNHPPPVWVAPTNHHTQISRREGQGCWVATAEGPPLVVGSLFLCDSQGASPHLARRRSQSQCARPSADLRGMFVPRAQKGVEGGERSR